MSHPSITSFFLPLQQTNSKTTKKVTEAISDEASNQKPKDHPLKKRKSNQQASKKGAALDSEGQASDDATENPSTKRLKSSNVNHKKKEKSNEKPLLTKTHHLNSTLVSRSSTPPPHPTSQSTPITIDLTLDSPENMKKIDKSFTNFGTRNKPGKKSTFKTTHHPEPPPKEDKVATKCKTFADFEEARRQKQLRNSRPIVEASWPSGDHLHQRFLDELAVDFEPSLETLNALGLKKNKGKKPLRLWSMDEAEDKRWMKDIKMSEDDTSDPIQPVTLERLELQPPVNLIQDIKTNPIYRHPLLARLIKLISWPHQDPIPYDHPTLRRQHHRSTDSLTHLWTTSFAPQKATEVLGTRNLQNALTLKSWLREIALKEATHPNLHQDVSSTRAKNESSRKKGSTKRRKQKTEEKKRVIIRAVETRKRRKKRRLVDGGDESDGMKDFIVSDEDEDTIYAHDVSNSDSEGHSIVGGCSPRKRHRSMSPRKRICSISVIHPEFVPTTQQSPDKNAEEEPEAKFEFDNLTNLILLKGPHGTGKSCAVHAVAEELGWDVFEVNPSQLRTRKEVDRLIGDVSKNHVLSCSSKPSAFKSRPSTSAAPAAFSDSKPRASKPAAKAINPFEKMMQATKSEPQHSLIEEDVSIWIPSKLENSDAGNAGQQSNKKTKQSLILLEEVDIVFGQDKDFWAGVIELVSKSMRPVVMTCNDESLLPMESLPVQTVLEFEPAEVEQVSGFLEVVCLVSGFLVDRKLLERLYLEHVYRLPVGLKLMRRKCSSTHQLEIFQEPSPPPILASTDCDSSADLRRTMCQLQFYCQWSIGSRFSGVDWLDLQDDRTSKMLFCSNPVPSPPSLRRHLQQQQQQQQEEEEEDCLSRTPDRHDPHPFDRFEDVHFELDWLHRFLSQHLSNSPGSQQQQPERQDSRPQCLSASHGEAQQLELLARAHDGLSFGDAYIDKDCEIEVHQFESELTLSSSDNVSLASRSGAGAVEIMRAELGPAVQGDGADEQHSLEEAQIIHPKRPFSAAHHRPESEAFQTLLHSIFSLFFSPDSHLLTVGISSKATTSYLLKFFKTFSHAHLVQTRSARLREMDRYMDFGGSRAFVIPLVDYILEYCPMVRRVFEAEYAADRTVNHPGRLTRASAAAAAAASSEAAVDVDMSRLAAAHLASSSSAIYRHDVVLSLDADEIQLFRNASDRFLL
ncbi:hypothetical protein PCASD_08290 [Puccinia coronata f. sp. avenae]|uniref:ATPase AAA-type core domain-containing protein n=1 Tax=Puccinia coronata f. sp. avenae TaxID=200324 RepID=A0A2N5V117_9BASI|nr:hypothetical protein PCASD_08290 [Puccinia coronata f. sp. avenae]